MLVTSIFRHCTSPPGQPCFASANFPDRNDALVVLLGRGSVVRSSVLTLEANGLVDEQVASDRVAGSEDREANDNTWTNVSFFNAVEITEVHDQPRGINSAGILRSRRRRCETV